MSERNLLRTWLLASVRTCVGISLLSLLIPPSDPAMAQGGFTLAEVMSAPFPEGLVSAPGAGTVAWTYNHRGARNIWVRVAGEPGPRRITNYQEDDGQAITDLIVTPDGASVIFSRGGAPNSIGEVPNPLSRVEGAKQGLFVVSAGGDEPRALGPGSGAVLSPDGSTLAFVRPGNTIWILGLEDGAEAKQVAAIRGAPGSLRWAPEGRRLAFVSGRGDHSFVGVLDLQEEALTYLDPTLNLDQSPAWSPDGERVAFIRAPYPRGVLPFTPVREALPWSIRVVEVGTGGAHTAWKAPEGPGSAFQGVSAVNQLLWAAEDRIVFPWEGNGWLNLYSVSAAGGEAAALSPGEFEVQFVALSPGGGDVLFSSNQGDIDRQHIWRASVSGGTLEQITQGRGVEWSPVSADDAGGIAFLASGATTPAQVELWTPTGGRTSLTPSELLAEFPSGGLVVPEQVIFPGADGMTIHGQLFLPPGNREGDRHPAVIFFHGGSRRQMLLAFHHRGYYHNAYAFNQFLANRGYVVLSVNYRSGIGYGMEFREALDYGAQGASEFNDAVGAGLYLRGRGDVDGTRIGLWGGSYGGYLTALGLARASDLFAAGVDLHGVHDWNVVIRNFVPTYDATASEDFASLALRSSPMADLDSWRSPVLLIHGDDDRNVPFSESVALALELRKRDIEFEELVFPDEVHGFLLHQNWLAAFEAASDFLDRKLKRGR
jgi:dipeptidyl aminopeptidase/acylaminoacyl peptidase